MSIKHELSSAYNPRSNGHAEQGVKTVKGLLKKTDNFEQFKIALCEWRNTPRYDGLSPAQWFCGYRQRTAAPAAPDAYKRISDETFIRHQNRGGKRRMVTKKHLDKSAVELEPLEIGDNVVVQDPKTSTWSGKGTVHGKRDNGRSYIIDLAEGGRQIRNRRQIRPDIATSDHANGNCDQKDDSSTNSHTPCNQRRSKRSKNEINYRE